MSVTTAPPAFADPLADDVLTPPAFTPASPPAIPGEQAHKGSLNRDRAALLAPDVEGQTGTGAIELVRSTGLIAAIETVEIADDSQQGLVIEQDPPPGTQMLREGVLTLQVAQAPAEPQHAGDDALTAGGHAEFSTAASDGYEDDTEQWFATLGPSARPTESAPARPPRRRRKHRPAPVSRPAAISRPARFNVPETTASGDTHADASFEVPPDPLPPPSQALPAATASRDTHATVEFETPTTPLAPPCDPPLEEHRDPSLQPTARHSLHEWREPVSPPIASYTLSDRHGSPTLQPTARYSLPNARQAVSPQPTIGDPPPDEHGDPSPQSAAYDPSPQEHWDLSQQPAVRNSLPDRQAPVSPEPAAYDSPAEDGPHQSLQPAEPGVFTSVIAAFLVRLPDGSVARTWQRRALVIAGAILGLVLLTRAGISHSHQAIPASLAQAPASALRAGAATTAVPHPRPTHTTLHAQPATRLPAVPPRRVEARRTSRELVAATAGAADPVPTTSGPSNPPSEPGPGPFVYLGK
jgi:hypothetical protein